MNNGEMIQYTAAEQMAAEYREASAKIREHILALGEQFDRLEKAFSPEHSWGFSVDIKYDSREHDTNDKGVTEILAKLKLRCWGRIVEKLNIRRLMSSKRASDLDTALGGGEGAKDFPEITPENIQRVAEGFLMSATEFMAEAVAEEYDHWRPRQGTEYKTNRNGFWKLQPKLIKGYTVDTKWGGGFKCCYHNEKHVTALDNIFKMLDGKGPVQSYKGDLATAIELSPDGKGDTDYFKFKCYGNGNIHLQFKRQDLLDLFNQIAAKSDRLGCEQRRAG